MALEERRRHRRPEPVLDPRGVPPVPRVLDDIADGLVSIAAARDDYGIVLTPLGEVDEAATAVLRATMRNTRGAA